MRGSLATQLRLGFAAACVLALLVGAMSWWITLNYQREIVAAYETQLRTTVQLAEAQSAFWHLRFELRQFMVEGPEGRRRLLEGQASWYAIVEERLAAYAKAASTAEERQTLTGLRASYQRYKQARPKFFELWQAGEKDDAMAWLTLTVAPFGEEAARAFDTQITLQQSFVEQDRKRSEREARVAVYLVSAITMALVAMLAFGYVYAMRMLRPIHVLRAKVEGMVRAQLGEANGASASGNEVAALAESFELMSQRLAAHTESLRQSLERLDFLLRATPAVIWTSAAEEPFGMTFVSANARALLGREAEEFLDDPRLWSGNIHPDDRERVLGALARIGPGDSHADEYRFRHQDGSWRWLRSELVVTRAAAGSPRELVGYWIDVTDRRRAQTALAEALRAKLDFMNVVTHELKTPLNSVIGFAELLVEEVPGPLNARQAAFAADILASGRRLDALVDGILEISRLDSAALRREPLEIGPAIEERMSAHRKAAEARRIGMRLEVAPDAGSVELDPTALRRMLDVLLDNAIKFNREGGTVEVSARRAAGALEIAIADTGIGIARADLAKLFAPLTQVDAALGRRFGGVGLGLALARRLVEMQGGVVEVESEPGKGSRFTLRLPIGQETNRS